MSMEQTLIEMSLMRQRTQSMINTMIFDQIVRIESLICEGKTQEALDAIRFLRDNIPNVDHSIKDLVMKANAGEA